MTPNLGVVIIMINNDELDEEPTKEEIEKAKKERDKLMARILKK
jgi:hypothetical protein